MPDDEARQPALALLLAVSAGLFMTSRSSVAADRPPSPPRPASIERIPYQGWADCYRLRNEAVEIVVVPAVARIMRYARSGGPNLLWENAWVAAKPPQEGVWSNYGGNKVWIWPMVDWPQRTGRQWPPATDEPALITNRAEIVDGTTLRLTSPEIPGFGARTIRDIRLAATGTRVMITSQIQRLAGAAAFPLAAWTVTQLPSDGQVFARLSAGSRLTDGYRLLDPEPFAAVARLADNVLRIQRPTAHRARLGLDADLLAWQRGDELFVERSLDTLSPVAAFAPGDRAQVYSHPDADPGLAPGLSYIELELTSPLKTLRANEAVTLETTWELLRLDGTERTAEAVARKLSGW
jgi:hypothetical protein